MNTASAATTLEPIEPPARRHFAMSANRHGLRPRIAGYLIAATMIGLAATGGSYALWSDATEADASTITSGSTGLTVNGADEYTLMGLDTSALAPGRSVVTAMPIVLKNTGTTPLSVAVVTTTVTGNVNALAAELTLRLTPAAVCAPSLSGGIAGRVAGFSTASAPYSVQPGGTVGVCLEVTLDADAPANTQNGNATFRMDFRGTQLP